MPDLDGMWRAADPAMWRCLELAHESFVARGLPVGSVVLGRNGEPIAEGRNRAYDPAGGSDRLQRTPIAHAEMNALACIDTGIDASSLTLWSTHRPCLMCAAACEFIGVDNVFFIAPDPSDVADVADPGGIDAEWTVLANLLFLSGVLARTGPSSPTITRARSREPETVALIGAATEEALRQTHLHDALTFLWPRIAVAANERRERGTGAAR